MGQVWHEQVAVTTTGGDGAAAGTAYSRNTLQGHILAAHVNYAAGCPSTTDLALSAAGSPSEAFLTLTDGTATGWYYPRRQVHSSEGAALTLDGTEPQTDKYVVYDRVQTIASGCNTLTEALTVHLYWYDE